MAIEVSWDETRRILYNVYIDDVTVEDLRRLDEESKAILLREKAPVYLVVDLRCIRSFPTNLGIMRGALSDNRHESLVKMLVVGQLNPLVRFIAGILTRLSNDDVANVETMEEALALIDRDQLSQ